MHRSFLISLVMALALAGALNAKDVIRDSVVQLHVTKRPPDFQRPWTKEDAVKSSGSGVIISDSRILTNWHVVEYETQLFVQLNQSSDKHPAVVEVGSPEMDLAIVRLEDESILKDYPALSFVDKLPSIRSTVNVYGYPLGGDDLSVTEGIVSRIEFSRYSYGALGLRIQVDAALNPGNSGGPAVLDGKLAGLVFSKMNQAENIGYLIPTEEVQRFLDDVQDKTYDGKLTMFDSIQTVENAALRDKLKLPEEIGGVMIQEPYVEDEDYPLKRWDVITQIDDVPIDKEGNVQIRDDLRLDFRYLIPEHSRDDKVTATIFRDGATQQVEIPVRSSRDFLLPMLRGEYPRHFILGPLVFSVATQEFVNSLGVKGQVYLSAMQSPMIERRVDKPAFEGEELVVMPNRMFPHRIIKGYSNIPFGVVESVNGVAIRNLKHLVELLRDCRDEFVTLQMAGEQETLVFRREELNKSTEEILSDEGIRYQYSKDLEEVWEGKG
ncbi:MAG: trypsin-like peptidase domain-containing protein [Planctomycetales bacterium]|nr:trypsin-like peptidase domain-containing protein [Planctomycetales bacterium]